MSGTTKTTLLTQMCPTRQIGPTRPTFVGLFSSWTRPILTEDRPRLEDVASGYWTLFIKQSSGLVSHYGSSPSSSAQPLGARLLMLYWWCLIDSVPTGNFAEPRLT